MPDEPKEVLKSPDLEKRLHLDAIKEQPSLPAFEPGLSPYNIHNLEAAKARGLTYDSHKEMYVDEDGCLIRDRFGQPL